MRCPACRVDLNENACRCPLCAGPAEATPPLIPGVAYQDYPPYGRGRSRRGPLSPWSLLPETALALSLLLLWGGFRRGMPPALMLASGAAALTLGAALALSPAILLLRRPTRCLAPLLCLALLAAVECAAAFPAGGAAHAVLPAYALTLSLMNLAALRGLCGKALLEEFRARFMF